MKSFSRGNRVGGLAGELREGSIICSGSTAVSATSVAVSMIGASSLGRPSIEFGADAGLNGLGVLQDLDRLARSTVYQRAALDGLYIGDSESV